MKQLKSGRKYRRFDKNKKIFNLKQQIIFLVANKSTNMNFRLGIIFSIMSKDPIFYLP